jgi:hypothetical protein
VTRSAKNSPWRRSSGTPSASLDQKQRLQALFFP